MQRWIVATALVLAVVRGFFGITISQAPLEAHKLRIVGLKSEKLADKIDDFTLRNGRPPESLAAVVSTEESRDIWGYPYEYSYDLEAGTYMLRSVGVPSFYLARYKSFSKTVVLHRALPSAAERPDK